MNKIFDGSGHISFRVKDMDKAVDYYVNQLGFEPMFQIEMLITREMLALPESVEFNPKLVKLEYFRIGRGRYLELFPVPNEPVEQHENQSFAHFCLHVDDIVAAVNELRMRGVKVYTDPISNQEVAMDFEPMLGKDENLIAWLIDPDGNKIELMELTRQSMQLNFEKEHPYNKLTS